MIMLVCFSTFKLHSNAAWGMKLYVRHCKQCKISLDVLSFPPRRNNGLLSSWEIRCLDTQVQNCRSLFCLSVPQFSRPAFRELRSVSCHYDRSLSETHPVPKWLPPTAFSVEKPKLDAGLQPKAVFQQNRLTHNTPARSRLNESDSADCNWDRCDTKDSNITDQICTSKIKNEVWWDNFNDGLTMF